MNTQKDEKQFLTTEESSLFLRDLSVDFTFPLISTEYGTSPQPGSWNYCLENQAIGFLCVFLPE